MSISTANVAPNHPWAERIPDLGFLSIEDLRKAVRQRRKESWDVTAQLKDLRICVDDNDALVAEVRSPDADELAILTPSHWSFGRLARIAQAPADYLRRLPPELAARNLEWGLHNGRDQLPIQVLGRSNGHGELRAITSPAYERIWDDEVLDMVERINQDGRWEPAVADYGINRPEDVQTAANALYASDRYMFLFLMDRNNPIQVKGEKDYLHRGIMVWNSEVGASVLGLRTFLYRSYCNNRTIFGLTDDRQSRIRHIGRARKRFDAEWDEFVNTYDAKDYTAQTEAAIKAALKYEDPGRTEEGWEGWLRRQGFTERQAQDAISAAEAEEGQARSLWDIIQGLTASARQIQHTDTRVELEVAAGRLMQHVQQ